MTDYKIERWDVVMFGSSNAKMPVIYFTPDSPFLEFAKSNNSAIVCTIKNTGTMYDGKLIPGVLDASCNIPNCRPNFCKQTGLYVVTLWSNWYGYPEPDNLGVVSFSGMATPTNVEKYIYPNVPQCMQVRR
jgi:hypothetical protein